MRPFLLLLTLIQFAACTSTKNPPDTYDLRYQTDTDRKPIPIPEGNDPSEIWDQAYNHFFRQIYRGLFVPNLGGAIESENVNGWDEVPDSTWFTNRIGRNPKHWTVNRVRRGARQGGPDTKNDWRVIRGKSDGVSAGFTIKDSKDDLYFIKFDPPGFSELGTSAEIISSLILHAAGYNVPENYVYQLPVSTFVLDKKAKTSGKYRKKRKMTEEDFFNILSSVEIDAFESTRLVASKALPGRPVGPFFYEGTRPDDPNDKIPHENRRELRAFHIFSAWLNNTDVRFQNTLDMYQGEKDKGYLKHFILDFGTSLGSSGNREKNINVGYEYAVDFSTIGYNMITLGLKEPYWRKVKPTGFSSIGTFESKVFDPLRWRSQYANRAFELITPRDAFWASKIIMSFTQEHLAAIVAEAKYSDPKAAAYMLKTLIERQRKIGKTYFSRIAPFDGFSIQKDKLVFEDLGVKHKLFPQKGRSYVLHLKGGKNSSCQVQKSGTVDCKLQPGLQGIYHLSLLEDEKKRLPEVKLRLHRGESGLFIGHIHR